jgi:hypothetical protein
VKGSDDDDNSIKLFVSLTTAKKGKLQPNTKTILQDKSNVNKI